MTYNFNIGDTKTEIEKNNYILSHILKASYVNRDINNDYVNIHQNLLNTIIPKGNKELKSLVKKGYLSKDGIYKIGKKSYGYKLNIPTNGIKGYINNIYELRSDELKKEGNRFLCSKAAFIIEETNRLVNEKRIVLPEYCDKIVENLKHNHSSDKDPMAVYNSQKYILDMFKTGFNTGSIDKNGSRIYTPISSMKSDIRKHIKIDGKYTYLVDIKNSQFQGLCILLKDKVENDNGFFEQVFTGNIYDLLVYKLFGKMRNNTTEKEFEELRSELKQLFLNWLYTENKYINGKKFTKLNKALEEFPEVVKAIYKLKDKKDGGILLSHILQKDEANTLVKTIQYNLLTGIPLLGIEPTACITVHDSIQFVYNKEVYNYIMDELRISGYKSIKEENYDVQRKEAIKKSKIEKKRKEENLYFEERNKKYKCISYDGINNTINSDNNIKDNNKYKDIGNIDDYLSRIRKEMKYYD
jgi:hypothetical protein